MVAPPRPPKPPKRPQVCARLIQNAPYGRVDVCNLEAGHDTMINPTPHHGKYHGIVWDEWISKSGRRIPNIIDQGEPFEQERLEGGIPVPEQTQRHMIDRASDERFGHQAGRIPRP